MASNSFEFCCRVLPHASVPEVLSEIIEYLREHPGWSEVELMALFAPIIARIDALENEVNALKGGG